MNNLYIIFFVLIMVGLWYSRQEDLKESFQNYNYDKHDKYDKQIIKYPVKEDVYMKFLGDLNESYDKYLKEVNKDSNSPIKQKALCDDRIRIKVQTQALKDAYSRVPEKDIDKDSELFDKNIPPQLKLDFDIKNNRTCSNKASHLCDLTNPMLYMSQNTYFPPRWIFKPYKDVPLPKHTDLKCWNNMLNCCNAHF